MEPNKISIFLFCILVWGPPLARGDSKRSAQVKTSSKPSASTSSEDRQRKLNTLRELKKAFENRDDLGLRILAQMFAAQPMSLNEWSFVRKALHLRPNAGFDLMFKWDQVRPGQLESSSRELRINNLLANADRAMLESDYDKSFRYFQLLARLLKNEITKGKRENYFLYWSSIHGMARALFGAGRYRESLQVYNWIGRDYFRYRQTLFEKMWAAFRANRLDAALGAIASQQSSFFSDFLEPESYLVQAYIFKKLCRDEELKNIRNLIRLQRRRLDPKSGTYQFEEWVRSDVETLSLYRLTQVEVKSSDSYFNRKKLEQTRILRTLQKRFETERKRLFRQMELVLGYSGLSVGMNKVRVASEVIPDRQKILKSQREFWPADSAEDWIDELGSHLFIGESQCPDSSQEQGSSAGDKEASP